MSFFDKLKEAVGIEGADYDEEYYDDYEDEDYENSNNTEEDVVENTISYSEPVRRNNVTDISSSKTRISIQEPMTYDDGPDILDDIMNRKIVILNLEMLEVDKKRQIFDFVSGGIYSLDGNVKKVTKDIFVIVPRGVEIEGKLEEELQNKSLYQL